MNEFQELKDIEDQQGNMKRKGKGKYDVNDDDTEQFSGARKRIKTGGGKGGKKGKFRN